MFLHFLFISKEGKKPMGKKCVSLQENKESINITYTLFLVLFFLNHFIKP